MVPGSAVDRSGSDRSAAGIVAAALCFGGTGTPKGPTQMDPSIRESARPGIVSLPDGTRALRLQVLRVGSFGPSSYL